MIVAGPLFFGLLMFLLPFIANKGERAPSRRPWAVGVFLLVLLIMFPLWFVGEQAPWSPALQAQPLPASVVASTDPTIIHGAQLFHDKGCIYCHTLEGRGGARGPNLSTVGSRLSASQFTTRILNGGNNMPAYGSILQPDELDALVAFLRSRQGSGPTPETRK